MRTKVINLHKEKYDVYIGRAGRGQDGYFGNPVKIGHKCPLCTEVHKNNGSTLPCYLRYFRTRIIRDPEFRRRVEELEGKILGCFCKPDPCHGDILIDYLNLKVCPICASDPSSRCKLDCFYKRNL